MDKQIVSIIFSLILYILAILIPLIPAVLIYKIFPKTKVGAKGMLGNITINATGAFAGYIVVFLLGLFLITNIHQQIIRIECPTWTIKTNLELQKEDGTPIENQGLLDTLEIYIQPELNARAGKSVQVKIPGSKQTWFSTYIQFKIPKWGSQYVNLQEISEQNSDIDDFNLLLNIKDPVIIKNNPIYYTDYIYVAGTNQSTLETDALSGPPAKE